MLYDAILDGRAGHGRDGLYFGENGEYELRAVSERIGEALVALGVSTADERAPTPFDEAEYARPENRLVRPHFGVSTCLIISDCSYCSLARTRGVNRTERVRWDGSPNIRPRTC